MATRIRIQLGGGGGGGAAGGGGGGEDDAMRYLLGLMMLGRLMEDLADAEASEQEEKLRPDLSDSQLENFITLCITQLKAQADYTSTDTIQAAKALAALKESYEERTYCAEVAIKLDYHTLAAKMTNQLFQKPNIRDDRTFISAYLTLQTVFLFTEMSVDFRKCLLATGIVKSMNTSFLMTKPVLQGLREERLGALIKLVLIILYNLSEVKGTTALLAQENTVEAVSIYAKHGDEHMKRIAAVVLLHMVSEVDPSQSSNSAVAQSSSMYTRMQSEVRVVQQVKELMARIKQAAGHYHTEEQAVVHMHQLFGNQARDSPVISALLESGYAELSVLMLLEFSKRGILDGVVNTSAITTLKMMWAFTNTSKEYSGQLLKLNIIPLLLSHLNTESNLRNVDMKKYNLLQTSVGILHNISKLPESLAEFKKHNAPQLMQVYARLDNDHLKMLSVMLLLNILDQDDSAKLEDTGALSSIMKLFAMATSAARRSQNGFSVIELAEALNKAALNDNNKQKIFEIFDSITQMLLTDDTEEQSIAAQLTWTLSFDDALKKSIRNKSKCMDRLKKLAESDDTDVKRAATGALWIILEKEAARTTH